MRCEEIADFITELTAFCDDIVQPVQVTSTPVDAINELQALSTQINEAKAATELKPDKVRTAVLVGTPTNLLQMLGHRSWDEVETQCHSIVVDKVDLLQAMDFKQELLDVGDKLTGDGQQLAGKVIITTNIKDQADQTQDEQDDFN